MPPKASRAAGRRQNIPLVPGYSKRMTEALIHVADPARAGPIVTQNPGSRNEPFTVAEDEFILRLKAQPNITWDEVFAHFPERSGPGTLQVRCSRGINLGSECLADIHLFRQIHGINMSVQVPQNMYYTKVNGVHLRNPGSTIAQPAYTAVVPIPANLHPAPAAVFAAGAQQTQGPPVFPAITTPPVPAAQTAPAAPVVTPAAAITTISADNKAFKNVEAGQFERKNDSEMSELENVAAPFVPHSAPFAAPTIPAPPAVSPVSGPPQIHTRSGRVFRTTVKAQKVIAAASNKRAGSRLPSPRPETKTNTTKAKGKGRKGRKRTRKNEESEDDDSYMTLSIKLTKEERTGAIDQIFKEKRGCHALLDGQPRPEDEEARQARARLEMGKYDKSLESFTTINTRSEPQSAPAILQTTLGAPYPPPEAYRFRFGSRPEVAWVSLEELLNSSLAQFLIPAKEPYPAAKIYEKPELKPMTRDSSDYPDNNYLARRKRQLEGIYAGAWTVDKDGKEGLRSPRRRPGEGNWISLGQGIPAQFHNNRTPGCFGNVRPTHLVEYNEVSGSIRRRKRTAAEAGLGEEAEASVPAVKHVWFAY